ncbi:MAG: tetratricopeptide repeat protein [Nitrospirae bacterium]|nr:tetratricopeptide repeat protein [Nitrospirota bacterium]
MARPLIFLIFYLLLLFPTLYFPYREGGALDTAFAQETSASPLNEGIQLLNEGKPDEALKAFEKASAADPENPLPHYYAGVAYHRNRQPVPAMNSLNRALSLRPGMPEAILEIGKIMEELGLFDRAREAYRTVASGKENAELVQEAEERIRRLTIMEHSRAAARLFQEKRWEEALKELETVLSLAPEDAEARYASGIAYQRLGQFNKAVEAFQKVTDINPAHVNALMQQAGTYDLIGNYEKAMEVFRKVISLNPDSPQAKEAGERISEDQKKIETRHHFEAAADMIRKEQWQEALQETRAVLTVEPANPSALFNLGLIQYNLKQNDDAIEALKKAIEADPKLQKAYFQLGVIYDDLGRLSDAISAYEQVLTIGEQGTEAEKAKARIDIIKPLLEVEERAGAAKELITKEDVSGAIKEMEALIAIKRDDARLHLSLAVLYIKGSRVRDAAFTLEKAVTLSPKDPEIRFLLGQVYDGLREYKKSMEAYSAAIDLEKEAPRVEEARSRLRAVTIRFHFDQGKRLLTAGNYEAALTEMQAILEMTPDDPVALFNSGVLYERLNRTEEAEVALKKTISRAPDYVQAYLQLGAVLERLRKFQEAREAFKMVIEIQKEGTETRVARSRLDQMKEVEDLSDRLKKSFERMENKDWEGARKEMETVLALYPKNYIAYYYLGVILENLDIKDEARVALKKAIEINPGFTKAYIVLGNLYVREEEYEEARKIFKDLTAVAEGSPDAEVAEERLKQLRDWHGSFSMTHSFNSNIAFRANAESTVQSTYGLGLNYTIFRPKNGSLFAGLSGNQSVYYDTQLEGNGYTLQVNGVQRLQQDRTISGSISSSRSFFEGRLTYVNNELSLVATTEPRYIPTIAALSYKGSRGWSPVNKTSNSEQHNLTLTVSQKLSVRDNLSGSYSFSVYKNLDAIASNYANRTNAISVSYSRPIVAHLGLSLGYSISLVDYSNPDSTTFFQRFRRNVNQSYSGGLTLSFTEYVNFSLGYNFSYVLSHTNLAPLTSEEQQKLEDLLASPVPTVGGGGGYYQHNIGISISTPF